MVVTQTILERRLGVSAQLLRERDDAAELLVHALAQLPHHVQASVPASPAMRTPSLEFDHEILKSIDLRRDRGRRLMPINLARQLDDFRPTLLLVGGFSPLVGARIAAYASRREIPFGVWSGEIASRPTARSRVRRIQRKWIVDRAAFAVSYGWESACYLRSLRSDLPLVIGRNTTPT